MKEEIAKLLTKNMVAMVREKSGKNENVSRSGKSQRKIFDIVKVCEKLGNSVFQFIVCNFLMSGSPEK